MTPSSHHNVKSLARHDLEYPSPFSGPKTFWDGYQALSKRNAHTEVKSPFNILEISLTLSKMKICYNQEGEFVTHLEKNVNTYMSSYSSMFEDSVLDSKTRVMFLLS